MSQIRQVSNCTHRFAKDLKCLKCGIYNYKNQAIKTNQYASPFHFNLKHYLKSLRKTAFKTVEPKELSQETYFLLTSVCQKFTFTTQTLALGIYIYQALNKLNSNQKFWSTAALIVAGKAVELDKNVPYLNRFQRYAQKSFSQQEYQQAQRTIFESMNFEVQFSTFISFLDFYLTCGVLFKEDDLNQSLMQFFEDDILIRAKQFLKKGIFTKYNQQLLALAIIKEIRKKYNLKEWNEHLQEISGYLSDEIVVVSIQQSPLQQISYSNVNFKMTDMKGITVRKKFQNLLLKNDKPIMEKYNSISKSNTLKENSSLPYPSVSTKFLLQNNLTRKNSQNFVNIQSFASVGTELQNKRR